MLKNIKSNKNSNSKSKLTRLRDARYCCEIHSSSTRSCFATIIYVPYLAAYKRNETSSVANSQSYAANELRALLRYEKHMT